MITRACVVAGMLIAGLAVTGCGSSKKASSATSITATSIGSSSTSVPTASTVPPATTATTGTASGGGAAKCPTMSEADAALGVADTGPIQTSVGGTGIVCRYTGTGGTAAVAIFAHQSAAVHAGQVANAPGAPAMPALSGVGDGAYGATIADRSIVNAYSNASNTVVAAQAPGALAPVEALARVALADN